MTASPTSKSSDFFLDLRREKYRQPAECASTATVGPVCFLFKPSSSLVLVLFVILVVLRFREVEALTVPSPPTLFPRGRGFHSSAIVGFCFREAVALSVPLSSAFVPGGW